MSPPLPNVHKCYEIYSIGSCCWVNILENNITTSHTRCNRLALNCFFFIFFFFRSSGSTLHVYVNWQTSSPIFQSVTNMAMLHNCQISAILSHLYFCSCTWTLKDLNLLFFQQLKTAMVQIICGLNTEDAGTNSICQVIVWFFLLFQNKPKCLCLHSLAVECAVCSFPFSLCVFSYSKWLADVPVDEPVTLCCCWSEKCVIYSFQKLSWRASVCPNFEISGFYCATFLPGLKLPKQRPWARH